MTILFAISCYGQDSPKVPDDFAIKLGAGTFGIELTAEKKLLNTFILESGVSSFYFINRAFIQSRLIILNDNNINISLGVDLSYRQTSLGRDTTTIKFAPIASIAFKNWDLFFGMGETETDNCGLLSDRDCKYYYLLIGFHYRIFTF